MKTQPVIYCLFGLSAFLSVCLIVSLVMLFSVESRLAAVESAVATQRAQIGKIAKVSGDVVRDVPAFMRRN